MDSERNSFSGVHPNTMPKVNRDYDTYTPAPQAEVQQRNARNFVKNSGKNSCRVDYSQYTCHSYRELGNCKEKQKIWFDGIIYFLYTKLGNPTKAHEYKILFSSNEASYEPVNCVEPNDKYFATDPLKKDVQFIAIDFLNVKVRPRAVCLKSPKMARNGKTLRSFIIVAKEICRDSKYEILGEYAYTTELKNGGSGVFFVNATKYYEAIYVQQTGFNFEKSNGFDLERIEIHGDLLY